MRHYSTDEKGFLVTDTSGKASPAEIDAVLLDVQVRSDAAYIAQLVIAGETAAADEYATSPDVSDRIRRWKANR